MDRIIYVVEQFRTEEAIAKDVAQNIEMAETIKNGDASAEDKEKMIECFKNVNEQMKTKLNMWTWMEGKTSYSFMKKQLADYKERNPGTKFRIVKATIPEEQKYMGNNYKIIEW